MTPDQADALHEALADIEEIVQRAVSAGLTHSGRQQDQPHLIEEAQRVVRDLAEFLTEAPQ